MNEFWFLLFSTSLILFVHDACSFSLTHSQRILFLSITVSLDQNIYPTLCNKSDFLCYKNSFISFFMDYEALSIIFLLWNRFDLFTLVYFGHVSLCMRFHSLFSVFFCCSKVCWVPCHVHIHANINI
jgi:hypothetical protein